MANKIGRILIVDDEVELKNILVESLATQGYDAVGFTNGAEALKRLREQPFDILLTDLMMPEMDGVTLVREGLVIDPNLICIVMTGQGTIQTAVDAMKSGTFDYVLKPFRLQTILPVLTRAMNTRHLKLENIQLREAVAIHELCQTIAFTLDPQTILSKLADAALLQSDADEVSVLLPCEGSEEFYVAAVRGDMRERLLGERIPFGDSIASWVAREHEPLILNGEVDDNRFISLWPRAEIQSSISIPMLVAKKLVGILNLNLINRPRRFTLGEMKALSILAGTAAAALESASLFDGLQNAEAKYRSIFESAMEGVFQATPGGKYLTANPAMARILGYDSPPDLIASIDDISRQLFVDPRQRDEALNRVMSHGELRDYEVEAFRKDGTKIWLSMNIHSVRDEHGAELYCDGTAEDITERKKSESALRESEERYRSLVENARDIIYAHDLEGNYTSVNRAVEELTGYTIDESLKLNLLETVAPEYVEQARRMTARKLAGEEITAYELEITCKDGHRVPIEVNTWLQIRDGRAVGVQGIARDLNERKAAQRALAESERKTSIVMEAVSEGVHGVDLNGNIIFENSSATAMFGWSQQEMIGKSAHEIEI